MTEKAPTPGKPKDELVFGFVAPVGVDLDFVEEITEKKLTEFGYTVVRIRISKELFPLVDARAENPPSDFFQRTQLMMDIGDDLRKPQVKEDRYDAVALGVAHLIREKREKELANDPNAKIAYFIHSLKHPDEVRTLRDIYPRGFYLIGVHVPGEMRKRHLMGDKRNLESSEADELMKRDKQSKEAHGQKLVDTFHLADFFTGWPDTEEENEIENYKKLLENSLFRFLEIIFGHPNRTPTFGEYAMFLAFSASLRSADLSRQVGAVITKDREIIGAGANDCPKASGGLYWPDLNLDTFRFEDFPSGRDYTRQDPDGGKSLGYDSNRKELVKIKNSVLNDFQRAFDELLRDLPDDEKKELEEIPEKLGKKLRGRIRNTLSHVLENSRIRDLTEFGRVVHAEMEALLSCARKGVSTKGSTLYSTTFPCHNCAKHIIAAGVERVIFIQPYLKSKAVEMYEADAIEISFPAPLSGKSKKSVGAVQKVQFQPFVGVGPRRFFDLFSVDLGTGTPLERREGPGKVRARQWSPKTSELRIKPLTDSYFDRENESAERFQKLRKGN